MATRSEIEEVEDRLPSTRSARRTSDFSILPASCASATDLTGVDRLGGDEHLDQLLVLGGAGVDALDVEHDHGRAGDRDEGGDEEEY